jgi:hypothetical protein
LITVIAGLLNLIIAAYNSVAAHCGNAIGSACVGVLSIAVVAFFVTKPDMTVAAGRYLAGDTVVLGKRVSVIAGLTLIHPTIATLNNVAAS